MLGGQVLSDLVHAAPLAHRSPLPAARAIRLLRSLIDLRSRPLGPFARSARSSISAPGRSGHSLAPRAHRSPLPAARAIRSLISVLLLLVVGRGTCRRRPGWSGCIVPHARPAEAHWGTALASP